MPDIDPIAWLDQEDARTAECIRRYGVYLTYVGGGSCATPGCTVSEPDEGRAFGYTVGLFGLGHPELVIVGANADTTAAVLNDLAGRIRRGADLVPGELITFDRWPHRIIPEVLPNPGDILFGANRFYARPNWASVPAYQLSHDDTAGRFPWEDDYAAPNRQPRPGSWSA